MKQAISLLAGLLLAGAPALAAELGQDPIGASPVPVSHSVEQADATLAEVERDRAAVHARFAAAEQVCYTRFFVNRCLDQAKEERRAALASLRTVEVEASHFKREHAVALRDAELAERLRKDQEEQARRAELPRKAPVALDDAVRPPPAGPTPEQRQAEHDARVRRQQAEEAAGAGQRAANVAAFEQKRRDAAQRQADVAAKKAAKAAKAARAEQDAKAKAEASAGKRAPAQ